ncbi:MAG: hypothetical protein AAGD25_14020 [Cyanobacteria bacterium P01_F01_bin.150]
MIRSCFGVGDRRETWLCVEGKEQSTAFLNSAFDWLIPRSALVEGIIAVTKILVLLLVILPIHSLIILTADIIYPKLVKRVEAK